VREGGGKTILNEGKVQNSRRLRKTGGMKKNNLTGGQKTESPCPRKELKKSSSDSKNIRDEENSKGKTRKRNLDSSLHRMRRALPYVYQFQKSSSLTAEA